jgi:hypothetical protein
MLSPEFVFCSFLGFVHFPVILPFLHLILVSFFSLFRLKEIAIRKFALCLSKLLICLCELFVIFVSFGEFFSNIFLIQQKILQDGDHSC